MKRCQACGAIKSLDHFRSNERPNGRIYFGQICVDCKIEGRRSENATGKDPRTLAKSMMHRKYWHQMPSWLTSEHVDQINQVYAARLSMNKGLKGPVWSVDHIVPLHGENVSGLHVPWNLQIITIWDNAAKGNDHEH